MMKNNLGQKSMGELKMEAETQQQAVQNLKIERQNSKPRQLKKLEDSKSGEKIQAQGYTRPQGVRKMLTKGSRNSGTSVGKVDDSLNESQISQPTEMADKFVNQRIKDNNTAFRANATL